MICQGCGLDLTASPKDRVNLENSKSKDKASRLRVSAVWKEAAASQGLLIAEGHNACMTNKMCKTCFPDYDSYSLLQSKIIMNLTSAMCKYSHWNSRKRSRDMGDPELNASLPKTPKRARVESSTSDERRSSFHTPAKRRLQLSDPEEISGTNTSNINVSPAVAV